jgi:hypothetical protein
MEQPHICFDRVIPDKYLAGKASAHRNALAAFETEVRKRSASLPNPPAKHAPFHEHLHAVESQQELSATDPIETARMALIDAKKWDKGKHLRCKFLDGDDSQRGKVQEKATEWLNYANVSFDFVRDGDAEIRISFQADPGSWSAVGTDCLNADYFKKNEPTMNFGWLRDDTDDVEYRRVVVHEFGHALGCIHEHQSPKEHLKWDKAAVYAAFSGPPNNWSKDDIDQNILDKYSPTGISTTMFDRKSIMLYQFDASLFTDHKGTPLNTDLSTKDKQMITRMYPKVA